MNLSPALIGRGAVLFLLLSAVTAAASLLSHRPLYHPIPPGSAVITLSFTHTSDRREACRRFTPEELAKLPPNMRRAADCPRGRLPVLVELDIDGQKLARDTLVPTGLSSDGPVHAYRRFVLPAGEHEITARLRGTARAEGFDSERSARVTLDPGRNLVVDFRPDTGFVFR